MTLPMIIDSFAGGGGASTGIEMALGRSPDVAINHSGDALALHEANHPETLHLNSNIWDVDPLTVTQGRHVGLLWASPDCKHFSKAKGGAPKDRNIRDLAWVIVDWAEKAKPDVILMENVEEFRTWGPICDQGKVIQGLEGTTFDLWTKRLKNAGYKLQWRELRARDYGAPTIRKRFFMVARRDGKRIVWPKPTHGDPKSAAVKSGKLKPYRTAAECIDWSLPCPSIFDSRTQIKEKHNLTAVRPLAQNTLERVARGVQRYVLEAGTPFLVNLTHGGRVEGANEPFRTITGANRGEKAVIAPSVTKFNGGATGQRADEPMATITANSFIKRPGGAAPLGIVAPHLLSLKGTTRRVSPLSWPHPTVLAKGTHSAVIAPLVASYYGHDETRGKRNADPSEPLRTITTENRHALISPVLTYAQHGGTSRDMRDPHHTICANMKDQNAMIIPSLVGCGGRASQSRPRSAAEPIATATTKADTCLSTSFFAKYYGTGDGARTDEPAHTITAKDRFAHVQADLQPPTFGPEHQARAKEVAEFLRAHGAWDGGEFVTLDISGETYVMVDIGLRMLTPRELFNAQGFPTDYVIEGVWDQSGDDWAFRPFTKSTQVSCCGNSVCPDIARALVEANCQHLVQEQEEAA